MKRKLFLDVVLIAFGSACVALGFDLFLYPNGLNTGGLSGLGQIFVHLFGFGSVGSFVLIVNIPMFFMGYRTIGRHFFLGTLLGTLLSSAMFDLFLLLPAPQTEPLLGAIYGGVLTGFGCGLVFTREASTGGTDLAARLLKVKAQNIPIGKILLLLDILVVLLTGIAFHNMENALYSGISLYACSMVLDSVVYGLDYSNVALVITDQHEKVAAKIVEQLDRGVTYLEGAGFYTGKEKRVILCAIKRRQVPELKELVTEADPHAFMILQDAHQVLGDGFSRYSKNGL